MPRSLLEFFAEEANEYLDKLEAVMASVDPPPADELRRLSRALRGSARLADQEAIALAAGAVQGVAEDLEAGQRHWDSELEDLLRDALKEIRDLVGWLGSPPPDTLERAERLAQRLGEVKRPTPPSPADDERFRRYLGTELRGMATEIGDALSILERDPRNREPLKKLLRRIRPLRGIEGVDEIPAVGPAVAAVEEVILKIADTSATVGPGHLVLFRRARQALDDVATDLIRGERPTILGVGGAEIEDLKEQILDTAGEREITWISELFHEDQGPHVERCPMAERGAGSWEAFFALEATGSLDTVDRLRGEIAADQDAAARLGQRLAYTFRQLRERAVTFGHAELGKLARRAGAAVRAAASGPPWRIQSISASLADTLAAFREYLESSDDEVRRGAIRRAEDSLNAATLSAASPAIPIESLTYGADDALHRAKELWDEADGMLKSERPDVSRARVLLSEALGLVEHAMSLVGRGR